MRRNLRTIALALLCVLAVGIAAATLTSSVDPGDGEGTGSGGGGVDTGTGDAPDVDTSPSGEGSEPGGNPPESSWEFCHETLDGQPVYVLLFGVPVIAGLVVGLFTDKQLGFAAAMFIFWPALILTVLLTAGCEPPPGQEAGRQAVNVTADVVSSAGGGGGDDRTFTTPTSLILVLLVVATAGIVAAVLLRGDGEEGPEAAGNPDMADEQRQAAIGSAAGEAADRIEDDAGLANEVYRAWAEMAEPLPVDHPETSTPAEFAAAATDAGIRSDDVEELTTLFEEVRYGTAEATEEREQRAVGALRRIERNYADATDGGDHDA